MSDEEDYIDMDETYDNSYDFVNPIADELARQYKQAVEIDPESIDYSTADPDSIEQVDQALSILKHLRGVDKGMAEEMYYQFLLDKFDLVEDDPTELTKEEALAVASSFKLFCQYMFLCEYGFKFKTNWHHDLLCDTLEALFLGRLEIPRLIINIPPRYSKTQILIYFVAWSMGHQQDSEFIWISYSNLLSEESSFKIREVLLHDKYYRIFGLELDMSSKAKNNFSTSKKGKVYATSTGGTLTGKGAGKMRKSFGGAIIVDDGNNTLDAFSETNRNKANDWFANTLLSRRNNINYTPIIVVAQRVHDNDISGFLLPSEGKKAGGTGESYTHIKIPAILNREDLERLCVPLDSDTYKFGDPEKDEYPLWHGKIDLEKLRSMRDNYPALVFYGQYQQQSFVGDGAIIKASWLNTRTRPDKSEIKYRVFVLDTAQTKTSRADYNVILVACVLKDGTVYIEDLFRARLESPELTDEVLKMYRMYRPLKIYIEYKASGINLIQYLRKEKVPLPVEPIPRNASAGDGDKELRASGVAPFIRAGYVYIPEEAHWLSEFLNELMRFPSGTYDDQVDALVDLVAKEVVKGEGYLHPMDVGQLPIKHHTYEEEIRQEALSKMQVDFLELDSLVDLNKINYRGKPEEEESVEDWIIGLF